MTGNSTKKRFVSVTARLMVLLVAVCMVLTVAPRLTEGFLPVAHAAENYQVPAGATPAQINAQLNSYASGTTVNLLLGGDVDLSSGGIVIPSGLTVNFYMNGKTISYSKDNWNTGSFYGIIVNEGASLNVYSGSVSVPNLSNGVSNITLSNVRTDMSANSHNETSYVDLAAFKNLGALSINKNIKISVDCNLDYGTGGSAQNNSNVNSAATGVFNASDSASVILNAVDVSCTTNAYGVNANGTGHTYRSSTARAYSYGVYGGNVTVNGESKIFTKARVGTMEHTWNFDFGEGRQLGIAFGICSGQQITVNGGNFSYSSECVDKNDGMKKGTTRIFMGGIAYNTVIPVLSDGSITPFDGTVNKINKDKHSFSIFEATIAKMTTLPISGAYFVDNIGNFGSEKYDNYPNGTNTAGQYYDEAGNVYSASLSTTDGSHPTAIIRGAEEGLYRVHVVYRFWTDRNKNTVDTSISGNDGNVGYSYKPLGDGTNVVNIKVNLSGIYNSTTLLKSQDSGIGYASGGTSKNDYYWKQFNMAYASTSTWFSDYDVTSSSNRGTVFKSFVDGQNGTVCAGTAAPIYIFVDYYRAEAAEIKAEVGTGNSAAVTYTGERIKASSFGLKISDLAVGTDYTPQYNIDFTDNTKIPVRFTWTGTTAAGVSVSDNGNGQLPADAGVYRVTLNIAKDSDYDPNDCSINLHKNRQELSYPFTLTINQAPVSRGNLPEDVTFTYGERLNEALTMNSYNAKGVQNETVDGRFSFTVSNDGSAFKPVGSSAVSVTFTPTYAANATVKNYAETTFTVNYTVEPAQLVISPKAAEVVYGETEFTTPYSIAVTGLVGNDDTADVRNQIAAAIEYMVYVNGNYIVYNTDDVNVGSYDIRARVIQAEIPAVLSNYTYSYADLVSGYEINQLTVTKRDVTVKATAVSRPYDAANYEVVVSYELIEGRLGADDVRFVNGTGTVTNNNAGTQVVGGVTKSSAAANIIGVKSGNYQVSELIYATGEALTVEITKAIPTATTPIVNDLYYQRSRTLSSVPLEGSSTSVAGSWSWVNGAINPTVAVSSYSAKFTPTDNVNYDVLTVDVTINVRPTPVKITYNGSVEYGDPVPNITAYTYTAEQDSSFDINFVETTGNIMPSTTYTQGSAVSSEGYPVTIALQNFADSAGNYTFTAQNGKIVVTPRNIVFTVSDATIEYGDNFVPGPSTAPITFDESRLVGTDTVNSITSNGAVPSWNYNTTYNYSNNYSVGTYSIGASAAFECSANYTVSVTPGTLNVTKAPLTIKANNVTLAYNSEVPENLATSYTFVGAKKNERLNAIVTDGAITVDTNYFKGAPVNAEGYPISVNISGAVIPNYTVNVENGLITVVKATPVIRSYPTAAIVYGQTLADAVFTGGAVANDVPGTFAYNAASTKPAFSNEPYTNYTASFIPDDTANYNTVTGLAISLTVGKMPISGALAVTGIPMKTATLTVDVSGMTPDELGVYTFDWTMNGSSIGTGTSITLGESHVGQTITVTATAQGYYEGSVSYTTTEIAPELAPVSNIINAAQFASYFDLTGLQSFGSTTTVTYNAAEHPVTMLQNSATLANTVVGAITVKYNGSTEIPKNAGLYTVTVDVATPDLSRVNEAGVTTYSPASGLAIGTLLIEKAPYAVTVTIADKVYDGFNTATAASVRESGAMTLPGGAKDDVAFNAARAVYTFADANVGTGKDVAYGNEALMGAAADNYTLSFSLANGGKASITHRTLKVSVDPVEREYQENYYDVDLAFVVDVTTIAPADTSASVYVNEALATGRVDDYHAGLRRVSVSDVELAGSKACNYVLQLTNVDDLAVQIEKATPSYPLPNTGVVTFDSGRTLSNISLGDSRWAWADAVANVIPEAGTHTFTAVYTPDDTVNYAVVNYEVALTVKKAPVVIRTASFTTVYGDYAPTYYYTVSGLTGADTIKNAVGGYVIMSCAYEPGSDVGEYSIVLSGGFTSNNYSFTYQNGTLTVTPRPVYVTAIAESRPYQENNTNVNVTFSALTNIFASDSANVYLGGTQPIVGTIADPNAGVKSVSFDLPSLDGAKAGNYTLTVLNPDLTVEITKATLEGVILPTSGTVKYGATLSTTEFTSSYAGSEYGTFSMENPMSMPSAVGTTSDVYKVVFTPFNTINFATVSDYITLTVTKSDLNVELSMSGSADVGKKLYVATNNLPEDAYQYIEYKWYRLETRTGDVRDGQLVASGTTEYTVTEKDADHYIVCVATNKANSPYNINARVSSDNTVSKKSMSLWERLLKWFYRVLASITQLFGKIG